MRRVLGVLLGFLALAAPAQAGGPFMAVGAAEDVGKQQDYAFAKLQMIKARLVGLDTVRVTQVWKTGQTKLGPIDAIELGNAVDAAQFAGVRVILSLYPLGSSVTPLTDEDRADFAAFAVDVASRFPFVKDFIVGNEPNLNRFWMPQYGPQGEDLAAPAYVSLLATAYDALKQVRPRSTIYGGALAPRGVDKPGTGRDTHSPTTFIPDMGAAYRASGRLVPLMDAFAFHPYGENSQTPPDFAHPLSTSIGLADYAKLVSLLGQAFDGTAQRGSTLPIVYDEYGVETTLPPAKAPLYAGAEPTTTRPTDEATQARYYQEAMSMAFCQPTVIGLLLFHVQDEPALGAWQSGQFYVDGTPKTSLAAVRAATQTVRRGTAARCEGLQLTPNVALKIGTRLGHGVKVTLTCSIDCAYTITVDGRRPLRGTAVGGIPRTVALRWKLQPGPHTVTVSGLATLNVGPPGTISRRFTAGR
ncbi:MAG TPA: hypothetical protein VGJ77_10065 [Gaiellaceae bacterium]